MLPTWYVALFSALMGGVLGSFLNVVVYRVPAGVSLNGRSACPKCGHAIRPWHNVPVFGWLWLRGKCYDCGNPIAWRYPAVEAFTAAAFAGVTLWNGVNWLLPALLYFLCISIALALIDLDTMRLPDAIVKPSWIVVSLLLLLPTIANGTWEDLKRAGIGAAVVGAAYLGLWFVTLGLGLGFGDVKLAPILGAMAGYLSWNAVIVGNAAAWLLGGILGIALLIKQHARKEGRKKVPFGPFLLAGTWIGMVWGDPLWNWYLNFVGLS